MASPATYANFRGILSSASGSMFSYLLQKYSTAPFKISSVKLFSGSGLELLLERLKRSLVRFKIEELFHLVSLKCLKDALISLTKLLFFSSSLSYVPP